MEKEKKIVGIQGKKEPEPPYLNPQVPLLIDCLSQFVSQLGCSEMLVILLDGDEVGHIIDTDERSPQMLGQIDIAHYRYLSELDAQAEED